MAPNRSPKGTRSSSPSKASSTGGDNPGFAAWREFYAPPKTKAEYPTMKGKTVAEDKKGVE
ncbi:hypothetical protein JCM10295v2_002925 [Rhodotorula toruloides]